MTNFLIALVRTVVPIVVGWALAQLARVGIHLPADSQAELVSFLTVFLASLYYAAVAWMERKWKWFGWLLGIARNPIYEAKHAATP